MPYQYVVVVQSWGDGGEEPYGMRVQSIRFNSLDAAEQAAKWLSKDNMVLIVKDIAS